MSCSGQRAHIGRACKGRRVILLTLSGGDGAHARLIIDHGMSEASHSACETRDPVLTLLS